MRLNLTLDNYKSHINGKNKTIEGNDENGNWGKIPFDIIVKGEDYPYLYEIRKKIPLSMGYDDSGEELAVMRYSTLVKTNKFLKDFINSLSCYKFCKRGWIKSSEKISSLIEDTGLTIYLSTSLDEIESGLNIGNYAIISNMMEDMYSIFRLNENDSVFVLANRIKEFLTFYKNVIEGNINEYSYPYIDINVFIDADIVNVGTFSPLVEEWQAKRYYVGQIVMYEGTLYRLRDSDDLPEETIDIPNIGSKTLRYYEGYYNEEEHKTYFDEITEEGYKHWEREKNEDIEELTDNSGETQNEIIVESRLNTLKRKRKSYDDNGNVMPFIVNDSGETDIPFSVDIPFEKTTIDGQTYYDGITEIEDDEDNQIITFNYKINASSPELNDGMEYSESYEYETKEEEFLYEGRKEMFTYKNIIWKTLIEFEGYDRNRLYAKAKISESEKDVDDFQDVPYYLNEGMMGIIDLKTDINDYNIERGNSAAFEIHNVLGECCTMEDLETYRNNFFNIKNDEKM